MGYGLPVTDQEDQGAPEAPEARSRRFGVGFFVKAVVALLVTVVTLWWSTKDANLSDVFSKLGNISAGVLALYVLIQIVVHVLRIIRWGLVMRPLGNPSARAIFSSACAGIPAAFFLPLRLGEFVRPAMISRAGVPFAGAMANVVLERVLDGVVNVGVFFILLRFLPDSASIDPKLRYGTNLAILAFGGALLVLIVSVFAKGPVITLIRKTLGVVSESLSEKVVTLLSTFIDGILALGSLPRIISFIFLTLAYWGLNGAATYMLASSYFPQLPFMSGSFSISVVALAVAIPAGPAFLGPMQAGFKFGLSPFGLSAEEALVVAIAVHALQVVIFAVFAGIGVLTAPSAGPRDSVVES